MEKLDDRVNYKKLEREKILTSFYVAGYKDRPFKCDNANNLQDCKEAYGHGKTAKDFEKKS